MTVEAEAKKLKVGQGISRGGRAKRFSPVEALQRIQRECGYLPKERLQELALKEDVPLAHIYSVATFFNQFSLTPKGENVVTVCTGTACHVRGAPTVLEKLEDILAIKAGGTTSDGKFSLETVNCLGACALGPLISINGKYYGKMTPARLEEVIEEYGVNNRARKD